MPDGMAPVITWGFRGNTCFYSLEVRLRVVIIYNQTTLLVKPHVSYGFLVKRPAARIDHERDHEKIYGSTNHSAHFVLY